MADRCSLRLCCIVSMLSIEWRGPGTCRANTANFLWVLIVIVAALKLILTPSVSAPFADGNNTRWRRPSVGYSRCLRLRHSFSSPLTPPAARGLPGWSSLSRICSSEAHTSMALATFCLRNAPILPKCTSESIDNYIDSHGVPCFRAWGSATL